MNFQKIWLIARREYMVNVRRRSYLFTAFVIPILSIGFSLFASNFSTLALESTGDFPTVGIVDDAGLLKDITLSKPYVLTTKAEAEAGIKAIPPTFEVYYVLPADYLKTGQSLSYSIKSLPPGLDSDFNRVVRKALAGMVNAPEIVSRLQDPIPLVQIRQVGNPQKFDQTVLISAFIAPFIFALLLITSTATTSQFLMSGVVEEKENRMMEVFVTSARTEEMLAGKILGLGALGLTQMFIWVGMGLLYAFTQTPDFAVTLASLQITPGYLALIFVYFILSYLFNGAVMAGIGVSVNAEQESRQVSGLFVLVTMIPFFFIYQIITEPNGTIAVVFSIIPFTSALTMILRATFTTVPPEQAALSLILLGISVMSAIWVTGRVFRIGMLSYGKSLNWGDVLRVIRRKDATVLATSKEG
jgi:ABC-2 type transport system permease protein